jgi:hypothetical protein
LEALEALLVERSDDVEAPQRPKRDFVGAGAGGASAEVGVDGTEGDGDGEGEGDVSVDVDAFADDARLEAAPVLGASDRRSAEGLRLGAGVWYAYASRPAGKTVL